MYSLNWTIKDSLLGYMRGLEDGIIKAEAPAVYTGSHFTFGEDSAASNFDAESATGTLQFLGTATLSGYGGMMNIVIKNPLIELDHGRGTLLIASGGILSPETYVPLVQLERRDGTSEFGTTLTVEGRGVLGEQYQVGQEFTPLTIAGI